MSKEKLINDIKRIIVEQGSFNISEVSGEIPVIIAVIGHTTEVADSFDVSGVNVDLTVDENIIDYDYYFYEDLTEEVLENILSVCESYETDNQKTMKRCK